MGWGTKYRIGFHDSGLIPWKVDFKTEVYDGIGTNFIAGWTNGAGADGFPDFSTTGSTINYAVNTNQDTRHCYTNAFYSYVAGEQYIIRINLTNRSGASVLPVFSIREGGVLKSTLSVAWGFNEITYTAPSSFNGRVWMHATNTGGINTNVGAEVELCLAPTILNGSGSPCKIEWENSSDKPTDTIRLSTVIIQIMLEDDNFSLMDLYSDDDLKVKVDILQNEILYWKGWVMLKNYQEPYDFVPHTIQIPASCGLEILKEIPYMEEESSGEEVPYNGRMFKSQIILDILEKIGHTQFTEYVNLYEIEMDSDVGDSLMDQCKVDVDVFYGMYCDEVLENVMKSLNAVIVMKDGTFKIYRPFDCKETTVHGRIFTAVTTKSAVSYTTTQYISRRDTNLTTLKQVPGGMKMIQSTVRKVTCFQNFGNKESWLDNWEFKEDSYQNDDFKNWERTSGMNTEPIGEHLPGEPSGAVLPRSTTLNVLEYMSQTIGAHSLVSSDMFVLSFDYLIYNFSGGTIANCALYIMVKKDGANYWLRGSDSEFLTWDTSEYYVGTGTISVDDGSTGWRSIQKKFIGLPASGSYTVYLVRLYSPTEPDVVGAIKNIRIYCTSSEIRSKKVKKTFRERVKDKDSSKWLLGGWGSKYKTVTYTEPVDPVTEVSHIEKNDIQGRKELEFDYLLGDVVSSISPDPNRIGVNVDNVIEQFAGAIAVLDSGGDLTPSSSWGNRYWESSQVDQPLMEIIKKEMAHHYSEPRHLIQMPIQDTGSAVSAVNIIGHFQDDLNLTTDDSTAVNRRFVFNRGTFDVRNRRWNIDLMEIDYEDIPIPPEPETLDAPVATDATDVQQTSFTANWNSVTGAVKYMLDVSSVSNFASYVAGYENKDIGNNLGTSVTDLTANTDYWYRVRAVNIFDITSVNSNSITLKTTADPVYNLYTNTKFWFIPEPEGTTWTVTVYNIGGALFNDNFKVRIDGETNETVPFSINGYSGVVVIQSETNENVESTFDTAIPSDWNTSVQYTLTIWYDKGMDDWVLLATKTYN